MVQLKPIVLLCLAFFVIAVLGDHVDWKQKNVNVKWTAEPSQKVYRLPTQTRKLPPPTPKYSYKPQPSVVWYPKPAPKSTPKYYGYPNYVDLTSAYVQPKTYDWSKYYTPPPAPVVKYIAPKVQVASYPAGGDSYPVGGSSSPDSGSSYPVGGSSYPDSGSSYPVGGSSYPVGGDTYSDKASGYDPISSKKSHGKDAYLQKMLDQYKEALASCTNPHNFACKFDITAGEEECDLRCIPLEQRCDGRMDCPNGDDEKGCDPPVCDENQVRCCSTQECATPCNDVMECAWGEDERGCEATIIKCSADELKCPEGTCAIACDGVEDCINGEDENNCNFDTGCQRGEVICPGNPGDPVVCGIWCDGIPQCPSNHDESSCNSRICGTNEIPCETIQEGSVAEICAELCDDHIECDDGRDENIDFCYQCVFCSEQENCNREDNC